MAATAITSNLIEPPQVANFLFNNGYYNSDIKQLGAKGSSVKKYENPFKGC